MKNFEIKIAFSIDKADLKNKKIELVKGDFEAMKKVVGNIFTADALKRITILSLLKMICQEEEESLMGCLQMEKSKLEDSMAKFLSEEDSDA